MEHKSSYQTMVNLVNEISAIGTERGLGHLYTDTEVLNGRHISIKGRKMVNFGSCGYLGLELDQRMKEAAIEAVQKYGTYFSCSRTYVSCGNYKELENLLEQIFKHSIVLTTNSTLGHQSVMPIVIGADDMVVFDQQAHISMQELSYKLRYGGTEIAILRHNRLDELENKIIDAKGKYNKIWYIIDGVYSMFGDFAPIKEIIKLMNKHRKLHLYVDDAHGMSWAGPNGSGYTLSQIDLHPKMILGTSMAKGFGSCGGIFIFKDPELRNKVKRWGGPLTYSGPQEPATIAAAIASAKIHLSGEIYDLQKSLVEKIKFTHKVMAKYKVPLVSDSLGPINFVGLGLTRVGYNLVQRIINEGFYTNIGAFPAVPETCTGMRFTITNHLTFDDIENLGQAIAYHLPKALEEEGRSMNDIYRAFRKFVNFEEKLGSPENITAVVEKISDSSLELKVYRTIKDLNKQEWDSLLGDRGAFTYDALALYEDVFTGNPDRENNWKFFYYLVKDGEKTVLATFFTLSISKDDAMAPAEVSKKIERMRKKDSKYYLASKYFMMGSQITNGDHLYIDRKNARWKEAIVKLLDSVWAEQDNQKAKVLYMRDFALADDEFNKFMMDQGFIKAEIFENNFIGGLKDLTINDFINKKLKAKQRYQIKTEVLPNMDDFSVRFTDYSEEDIRHFYDLYINVKRKSFSLNTYDLPISFFELAAKDENWEFLTLEYLPENRIVSVGLCYKIGAKYCPVVFGMDSIINSSLNVYKKTIFQAIKRGLELKADTIYLGLSSNDTKKKFGAEITKQVGFLQSKDSFNQSVIESLKFATNIS
jgi:7-keto-8-aminopelargonate synthetase-like enzyme